MLSSRARVPAIAVALVVVSTLCLAACSGGGSGGGADRASSRASTTTRGPATTLPGASDQCSWFHGSTTVLTSSGPTAPAVLVDADAGARGCLDVVTLTFETRGDGTPPGYTVGYHDADKAPFMDGDSQIDVPGNAHLAVTVAPATSTDPAVEGNPSTYRGNLSLGYGNHHHLEIVRELPDANVFGQNTVNWVIGLDSVRPFRVDRAEDPPRVMILIG
jgi:hypothetical protein